MTPKAEEYRSRRTKVGAFEINIESYRLGDTYHCKVDNVQPGAVLARGQGKTREEAERVAGEKAKEMLAKTRVFPKPG
ncbi:MAG: hypothetical protein HY702_03690 [Gemmatimonadetes bacterium]|nr:hypothetical protein [Gemmatimonadota bacterium]